MMPSFTKKGPGCPVRLRPLGLSKALALAAAILSFASPALSADDRVVATVGRHQITANELEAKIKPQMAALKIRIYEIKKGAIQSIADDYLLAEAANKEKLTVDGYLKRHIEDNAVTPADAKKYYDGHKELQSRFPAYDQIKDRLLQALRNQRENQQREALLDRLRKDAPVKVMLAPPRVNVESAGHPELGPKDAPITIVEFADFQCPFCKGAEAALRQVRQKYGDKVRLVYLDFPLEIHAHAMDAALAARCAAEQGKFWPYHDRLFADQSKLAPADLKRDAKQLGLDSARFDACLDKGAYRTAVEADRRQGADLGVNGTPAFFINGRPLTGAQPFAKFAGVIDEEIAAARERPASAQKQARSK